MKTWTLAPLLTLILLSVGVTPALAAEGYETVSSKFGSAGTGPGQFNEPTSVAVNDETGEVYVLDSGNDRIEWFTAAGAEYKGQFNGSGAFEVGNVKKTGTPAPTGEFLDPTEIAVNNDPSSTTHGDVYVADTGHDAIDEFNATGEYEGQTTGGCETAGETPPSCNGYAPFKGLLNVAVDPSGDLFVFEPEAQLPVGADYEGTHGEVYEFSDEGAFMEKFPVFFSTNSTSFAVDSSGDVYVHKGNEVYKFQKATGARVGGLELPRESTPAALAVISSTNGLLVDEGSDIQLFTSPFASTTPLVTFPGEGLPESLSESAGVAVNGALGDGTVYATERVADDVDVFAESPPKAPVIVGESASSLDSYEGTFAAVINPGNRTTTDVFEYSTSKQELEAGNGTKEAGAPIPAEVGDQPATSPVIFLFPSEKTYYYRVVAENEVSEHESKPVVGPVEEYTKLPLIAESDEKVSNPTSTGATLEATINPVFEETTYAFEYAESKAELENHEGTVIHGATGFYQQQKLQELTKLEEQRTQEEAEGLIPPGTAPICPGIEEEGGTGTLDAGQFYEVIDKPCPISAEVSGLQPGVIYYYRVVAKNKVTEYANNANKGEPVPGKIEEFTPYARPSVTTGEAQNITRTGATLSGAVNPEGTEATYYFEYVSEAGYQEALKNGAANPASPHYQEELAKGVASPYAEGETTVPLSLPAGSASQPVGPVPATGLRPDTTYHYALVATNKFQARTVGPDYMFRTTSATPPSVSTGGASGISQNSATLSGTVTTNGLQTNYGFEIGTEPGEHYGPATGLGSVGGAATEEVSVTLGELQPGTTYYYRVTATNADGTTPGQPGTFTTPGFPTLLNAPSSPAPFAFAKVAFPKEEKESATSTKGLTTKQKLAKALKQCKRDKSKAKRQTCERAAHRKYEGAKGKKRKK